MENSYFRSYGDTMKDDNDSIAMKDQVRRLTAIVREYQRRYMRINEDAVQDADMEPWMSDPSAMSPLLMEYDSTIKFLNEEVKRYKNEFERLEEKSRSIVSENNRLHKELRQAIENQLNAIKQSDSLGNTSKVHLDQLQLKLKTMSDEKDHAAKLYEDACFQMEHLKKELNTKSHKLTSLHVDLNTMQADVVKARNFAEQLQATNMKMKMENEKYLDTAQKEEDELEDARIELRKMASELKTQKSLNHDLQNHLSKIKEQMKYLDKNPSFKLNEQSVEGTLKKLQNENLELESRVLSYSKEMNSLRLEKDDLEEQLSSYQRKNAILEENEYEAIIRVRDSVQLVENALLEREQALMQSHQKSQEVTRLQEALKNVVKQTEELKKKEIQAVKENSRKQIEQLVEDLHTYEVENAQRQTIWEKLKREKTALEKELEKLYEERPLETNKMTCSVDELQQRLSKMELHRDEANMQIDSLQSKLRREKARSESDRAVLTNQISDYKKQLKVLKSDLEKMSESRVALIDEVNALKKELLAKREENEALDISYTSQVSSLRQKLDMKDKELNTKLRVTESSNKEAMSELREMLSLQQKNGTKWREESRVLCQKFENMISQLRQENTSLKEENNSFQQTIDEYIRKNDELERNFQANQSTLEKFQRLYTETDERAEVASSQVHTLLSREKQLLNDRKLLNREVDKLKLNLTKSDRLNTSNQWSHYLTEMDKSHF